MIFRTIEDADEYVAQAVESEGEQRAEYGSGAVSLGYDGSEAMMYYDGYRAADDPDYRAAKALLDARYRTVIVTKWPRPAMFDTSDDIPF